MKSVYIFIVLIFLNSCSINTKETSANNNVVASLGDEEILKRDIDPLIQAELYESLYNTYYARRMMIDQLLADRILERTAKGQGISKDSLVSLAKQKNITKTNLDLYVAENSLSKGIPDPTVPGRLVDINSTEGAKLVKIAFEKRVVEKFTDSLKAINKVKILIDPPLPPPIDLSEIDYHILTKGIDNQVFWVFSDFTCKHCINFYPSLRTLVGKYGNRIQFRYTSLTAEASDKYILSEFAASKNKFGQAVELLYTKSSGEEILRELSLDKMEFEKFRKNSSIYLTIRDRYERLMDIGRFQATPTIILNNRVYYGDLSLDMLERYINEYLLRK